MNFGNLLIVCTSYLTFKNILKSQISFLNQYYKVTIASSNYSELKSFADSQKVNFIHIPMYRKINPFYDLYSTIRLCIAIRKIKPNIIHSFTPKAGLVCSLAGYLLNVDFRLHTFTGLISPYKKGYFKTLLILVDKLICKLNTHIIAEGKGVKNLLIKNKITSKRIFIVGNGNIAGVDTNFYNPTKQIKDHGEKLDFKKSPFTFIYIGRFNRDKGIKEMLIAFSKIRAKNSQLLLLGDFDERNNFSEKIREKYIKKYKDIHHVNWTNDIRPYLAISDCLVLPSYREGFPNVILQASSFGIPTIGTNVPGSNEIIIDGYNGWIIESKNEKELRFKMEEVLSIPKKKLKKIGLNARSNVKAKYEQKNYRKKLLNFYNNL